MGQKFNPLSGTFDIVFDKAEEIKYTATGTIITGDDVQQAIEELESVVENLPTPLTYVGTWDASANSPTLDNSDVGVEGFLYQVNVAGTVNFGAGNISFQIGDKVVNNGTLWEKWDMVDAVESVNGQQGIVSLDSDDISEGAANLYFTDTRARDAIIGAASTVVTSNLTANRALVSDASGKIDDSAVTDTELGYVSGVTSAIQTQLNGKQATITGAATSITSADLTASRALQSNGSGKVEVSSVTSAELGYVSGVTSAIQTQLNDKAATTYVDAQDTEYGNRVNRNYLQALYSGASIAGINQYQDAAATVPVDGTGGSPAGLTTALNTTTELRRASSQRLSKDAANRQGMGWSTDMTVDRQDYEGGKPLFVTFGYETSASYASGDIRLFAYDITNATLLNVTSINGDGSLTASPDPSKFTGVFYPVSSSSSYRLIAHITSTNASAWDLDVIDLSVSPQTVIPGAIVADYGTEVWADNQANATTSVRLTRIGNRVFVRGVTTYTGAQSGAFTLTIPAAYTPDTTVYSTASSQRYIFGWDVVLRDVGTGVSPGVVYWDGTNLSIILDTLNNISATTPFTWVSGDSISFEASWIVSNWQASAALSTTETLFSTAKARYARSSAQTISSGSPTILNADTKTFDTLNSVTTGASWKFTAPRSGYYKASCTVQYVSRAYTAGQAALIQLYKNGVFVSQGAVTEAETTTSIIIATNHIDSIYLAKDDYIDFRAYNEGSVSTNTDGFHIQIEEMPDFSIFSTYGQFELLTATSSTKTPGATDQYQQFTGNSLTLTPGTWRLSGLASFTNSGGAATFSNIQAGWFGANGADTGSTPTALSTVVTVMSAGPTNQDVVFAPPAGDASRWPVNSVIVRATSAATVYLVTYASMTTAANARITVYANAERLQ